MMRYDKELVGCDFHEAEEMVPSKDGEWVRYEDVAAEIERLQAVVESVLSKKENI